MAKKKLNFSEKDIIEIEKFREYFANLEIDGTEISNIYAGGCGEQCMITCAYYCEPGCERTCNNNCVDTCSNYFSSGGSGGCFLCGTGMDFFVQYPID